MGEVNGRGMVNIPETWSKNGMFYLLNVWVPVKATGEFGINLVKGTRQ